MISLTTATQKSKWRFVELAELLRSDTEDEDC